MKKDDLILIGAAVLAFFFMTKKGTAAAQPNAPFMGAQQATAKSSALDSIFGNMQATLGNGNILDTSNGVIYDPLTGNYTNIYTGQIIYAGGTA